MMKNNNNVIIGMDISKDKIDIWYLPDNQHEVIENSNRAIGAWLKNAKKHFSHFIVALEPTGGYEKLITRKLIENQIQVYSVHPNRLHHFAKSLGCDAKTDKIASKLLAEFVRENGASLAPVNAHYTQNIVLKELSSRRNQLKKMIHAEQCRSGHEFFSKEVRGSSKRLLKQLEMELARLEKEIDEALENDQYYSRRLELLQTYKGVGRVVAQTLVLDMPELGDIGRTQASRLIGVAPLNKDSGKKMGQRKIQGGRGSIRKVLYMSAQVAARFNPEIKAYYEKLLARGKEKKVALMAVVRKIICTLNAMLRDGKPWQGHTELTMQNA